MSYLLLKERRINRLLPTRIISDPKVAQLLLQPTRWKILSELSYGEKCAKDLAETFHTSEQVICYHLRELEKAGLVVLERTVRKRGAMAKYYRAEEKAVAIIPRRGSSSTTSREPMEETLSEPASKMLDPFISKGHFNGHIVLGSPDAHGIFSSRARCGDRATDLALFIGSLLPVTRESVVRLDTELSEQESARNLIVVGGPRVNTVTMAANEWLSITYELTGRNMMISRLSGRSYAGEEEGAVQLITNPNNQDSKMFVIAGNSYLGTRAAVLAFIKYTDEIAKGNTTNRKAIARVVTGLDVNSDGLVDDVQFLE
jgi:DNA-binding transcriptional ArsR family regulator